MSPTYFEDLIRAEAREAGRSMVFASMRQRRARLSSRPIFTGIFWLLGVTR